MRVPCGYFKMLDYTRRLLTISEGFSVMLDLLQGAAYKFLNTYKEIYF